MGYRITYPFTPGGADRTRAEVAIEYDLAAAHRLAALLALATGALAAQNR